MPISTVVSSSTPFWGASTLAETLVMGVLGMVTLAAVTLPAPGTSVLFSPDLSQKLYLASSKEKSTAPVFPSITSKITVRISVVVVVVEPFSSAQTTPMVAGFQELLSDTVEFAVSKPPFVGVPFTLSFSLSYLTWKSRAPKSVYAPIFTLIFT